MSQRRALIVAIDEYPRAAGQFASLPGARKDAVRLDHLLRSNYGFHTELRIGPYDLETLEEGVLEGFLRRSRDADVVLFYFAGHGLRSELSTYLIPGSAYISTRPERLLQKCLNANVVLKAIAGACPNAYRISIFDCCRSKIQSVFSVDEMGLEELRRIPGDKECIVYTTDLGDAAHDRLAPDDSKEGNVLGPFSNMLQEALQDTNLTFISVLNKVKESLLRATAGIQQMRVYYGDKFGTLTLRDESFVYYNSGLFKLIRLPKKQNVTALDVSKFGTHLAISYGKRSKDGNVVIYKRSELRSPEFEKTFPFKAYALRFSPNGRRLLIGFADGKIGEWNFLENTKVRLSPKICDGPVNDVCTERGTDRLFVACMDSVVRILDRATFEVVAYGCHSSSVWRVSAFPEEGLFGTSSTDGTFCLWCVNNIDYSVVPPRLVPIGQPLKLASAVSSLRVSATGERVAIGTRCGKIAVYMLDRSDQRPVLQLMHRFQHVAKITRKAETHHSRIRVARMISKGKDPAAMSERVMPAILAIDFGRDEKTIAYSTDIDGYHVYDLEKHRTIATMEEYLNDNKNHKWHRGTCLRVCNDYNRLYVGCGVYVHSITFG